MKVKVAFFSAHKFDHEFFISDNNLEITFFENQLNETTTPLAEGFDVCCCFVNDKLEAQTLEKLKENGVRLIALRCAGFNNLDLKKAKELELTAVRVPAYSPAAVAEHTVGLMLALNRKIHRAFNRVREHNFLLDGLLGFDIKGKTIGIIGTGRIGESLAEILLGFKAKVIAFDPYINPNLLELGIQYCELDKLLATSDIISLNCPLTKETKHLINEQSLKIIKPGLMLINTGRGGLIDTVAVVEALKSGQIGYLGLDVYEEEEALFFTDRSEEIITDDTFARLLTFPNVIVTSHQAFFTKEALKNIADRTMQSVLQFFNEGIEEVSPEVVVKLG